MKSPLCGLSLLLLALDACGPTPAAAQHLSFTPHAISTYLPGVCCLRVVDMDGDGDLDIVAGSEATPTSTSQGISYLRNNGGTPPTWTRFVIDGTFDNVMSVDVARIDTDGYLDVVASSWNLHQVAWWRHRGDPTSSWTKRTILSSFTNAHAATCADIDQDGDTDVVAANSTPGSIVLCVSNGASPPSWSTSTLTSNFADAKDVVVRDLDRDGDPDIIATAAGAGAVSWWRDLGGTPPTWQQQTIASGYPGSCGLDVVDVDGDGRDDVIAAAWSSDQVAYWLSGDSLFTSWTKYPVTTALPIPVNVRGADFDGDGDLDIVAVGKIPGRLSLYENRAFSWVETVLDTSFPGGSTLALTDLDEDGDLDIVAGASGGELWWWENTSTPPTDVPPPVVPTASGIRLEPNIPNPFTQRTALRYALPAAGHVRLSLHDVTGRLVRVLRDGVAGPGWHTVEVDAAALPGGIYFCRLESARQTATRRIVLLSGGQR
jgi:hypothetical protein